MELLNNLVHGNELFHIFTDGIVVCICVVAVKMLYEISYLHCVKSISSKRSNIQLVVAGIVTLYIMALTIMIWIGRGLPELLDLPYELSGTYPRIYGTVVVDEDGDIIGIKDSNTGEVLYENSANIGHPKLEEYELREDDYVEAIYNPHTKRLRVQSVGEKAEVNKAIYGEKYSLESVNKKIQIYGMIVGFFCFLLSSGWGAWYIWERLERQAVSEKSTQVIRYKLLDRILIILSGTPLIFASIIYMGSWLQQMPIEQSRFMILICLLMWMAGILLSAVPYHTTLVFGEKEFYIGVAESMRTKYNKADIQSIEWREGNIMEITMQNGKKIKGRAEKNQFEIIKRKLAVEDI